MRGPLFPLLAQESLQRRVDGDGTVHFRIRSLAVRPQPDQFLHVGEHRHELPRLLPGSAGRFAARIRASFARWTEHIDGGITPPLGNRALHHNVPVEDAANGVRNGFIVIITFD